MISNNPQLKKYKTTKIYLIVILHRRHDALIYYNQLDEQYKNNSILFNGNILLGNVAYDCNTLRIN